MKHIERILISLQILFLTVKIVPSSPEVLQNMLWVWVVSPLWVPMVIVMILFILQEIKHKQVR